jgi:hypothetical protein
MIRGGIFAVAFVCGGATIPVPSENAEMITQQTAPATERQTHPYVGMWVTADGRIRHNLLPDGRYDEARGEDILYWDDTGFTADGKFVDGVLYHGGMVLHRKTR